MLIEDSSLCSPLPIQQNTITLKSSPINILEKKNSPQYSPQETLFSSYSGDNFSPSRLKSQPNISLNNSSSPKPIISNSRPYSSPILIRTDSFGYSRNSFSPPSINSPIYSKSPIPNSPNESFAGSFQESLLSGRMANIPSTLFEGFYAVITCSYTGLSSAPKIQIPFNTYCYHVNSGAPPPYVATIDLEEKFKIPSDGLLQVTIFNPTQTPIKTFIVKYDLNDMPPKSKTFLRQKTTTKTVPSKLEYAIHFRIVSPKKKRFYIYKNIRVVFPPQKPDEKLSPLQTETVFPVNPKFYPLR